MIKRLLYFSLVFSIVPLHSAHKKNDSCLVLNHLSVDEILAIGNKIWDNESNRSVEKLTWWNKKEDFPSFGIGHFIWYPCEKKVSYTQTFPALLDYFEQHNIVLPAWLSKKTRRCCPWKTHTEFYNDIQSKRMIELRNLLVSTTQLQTQFIIERTAKALNLMIDSVPSSEHEHIKKQFNRMICSASGLYAVIDYINFKGEGINPEERRNGKGWGLLQVLQCMQGKETGFIAIKEFVACAKKILTERVDSAPQESKEYEFLPGWKKRLEDYLQKLKL